MTNDAAVEHFIITHPSYDIRLYHNARWLDQKCTPDVLSIICDCIMDYRYNNPGKTFSSQDIWHSQFAKDNVYDVFKKPDVDEEKAIAEYNKFFMQPMELLAYSGLLSRTKIKGQNIYQIEEEDIIQYIAIRERNAIFFLSKYIEKVLRDSGIYGYFDYFFKNQTSNNFDIMKDKYTEFIINNTPINGAVEVHRIFTKVLNPLAYVKNSLGAIRGHISKDVISFDELMYNRKNFRDIYSSKPKDITRQEHASSGASTPSGAALISYLINRAKRYVRNYNNTYNQGLSEYKSGDNGDPGNHVHHIFPVNAFPTLVDVIENLICITPSQHYAYAHPNGNTTRIDTNYQALLLVAKSETIEEDYNKARGFYDFGRFINVLETGYNDHSFTSVPNLDFSTLRTKILKYYVSGVI